MSDFESTNAPKTSQSRRVQEQNSNASSTAIGFRENDLLSNIVEAQSGVSPMTFDPPETQQTALMAGIKSAQSSVSPFALESPDATNANVEAEGALAGEQMAAPQSKEDALSEAEELFSQKLSSDSSLKLGGISSSNQANGNRSSESDVAVQAAKENKEKINSSLPESKGKAKAQQDKKPSAKENNPSAITGAVEGASAKPANAPLGLSGISNIDQKTNQSLNKLRATQGADQSVIALGEAIQNKLSQFKAQVGAKAASTETSIKSVAASQKSQVGSTIDNSHAQVTEIMGATKEQISTAKTTADESLLEKKNTAINQNEQNKVAEISRLQDSIESSKEKVSLIFSEADLRLNEKGIAEAEKGQGHANNLAARSLEMGRAEAARYRKTEEDSDLGDDKANAVLEVANRFARGLRNDGASLGKDIREQTSKAREQVGEEKEPAISGFNEVLPQTVEGIGDFMSQIDQVVNDGAAQGSEHLDAAAQGAENEVSQLNEGVEGRASALKAEGQAQIDLGLTEGLMDVKGLAEQTAQILDEEGGKALNELGDAAKLVLNDSTSTAQLQQNPEQNQQDTISPEARDSILSQMDQAVPIIDQEFQQRSSDHTQKLNTLGTGSQTIGSGWVAETEQNMGSYSDKATEGFAQINTEVGDQLDQTVSDGHGQVAGQVDEITQSLAQNVGEIQQSVDSSTNEAEMSLSTRAEEGESHANEAFEPLPQAMRDAADAQESWWGKAGNWISGQLADTWEAIKGMADWGFVLDLAVGILAGIAVGLLVIGAAALIGITGGLALALVVGVAAGAAGFSAAQMSANLRNGDPLFENVGHAAMLGAFVGGGSALAGFFSLGMAAGAGVVALSAGAGTITANVATGKAWDDHLIANMFIMGIFHVVVKGVTDRIPVLRGRGTGKEREVNSERTPESESRAAEAEVERTPELESEISPNNGANGKLRGLLEADANKLKDLPFEERGPVVARALDTKTGKVSEAYTNADARPTDLVSILQERASALEALEPGNKPHYSKPGTHAEVLAVNELLKARMESGETITSKTLQDIVTDQFWLNEMTSKPNNGINPAPTCGNCSYILNGTESIAGKK